MAEKRILKRNIRFWGKTGLQLTGMMILFMVLYGFLFNIGDENILKDFWKTAYYYGTIISIIFSMIGPMSYGMGYVPLVLSFGSKRTEAVFGAQFEFLVYAVSAYIITLIIGYISSGTMNWMINFLIAELFIFMTAAGQFSCVAQMRYGMKGTVVVIVTVVICTIVGVIAGVGYLENIAAFFQGMQIGLLWGLAGAGLIVSVVLYVISVMVFLRVIKKYEVK